MYKITKDGATLGMTEVPTYIKQAENGCFVLCPEEEAAGIALGGVPYHLLGRTAMEGAETVMLEETDAGTEIAEAKASAAATAAMTGQTTAAARLFVRSATAIPDNDALEMPDLFATWEESLENGERLAEGAVINDGGKLYRVVCAGGVTPLESQPPHGEGMLAVYRPIDQTHAGTMDDPIPWVYGMDCDQGKYYSHKGKTYLCQLTMPACVYAPDTAGLWQWEEVAE